MEPKWFAKSKRFIGAFVLMIPLIARAFDMAVGNDEIAMINDVVDSLISLVGGVLALYGGWIAKGPLTIGRT